MGARALKWWLQTHHDRVPCSSHSESGECNPEISMAQGNSIYCSYSSWARVILGVPGDTALVCLRFSSGYHPPSHGRLMPCTFPAEYSLSQPYLSLSACYSWPWQYQSFCFETSYFYLRCKLNIYVNKIYVDME